MKLRGRVIPPRLELGGSQWTLPHTPCLGSDALHRAALLLGPDIQLWHPPQQSGPNTPVWAAVDPASPAASGAPALKVEGRARAAYVLLHLLPCQSCWCSRSTARGGGSFVLPQSTPGEESCGCCHPAVGFRTCCRSEHCHSGGPVMCPDA